MTCPMGPSHWRLQLIPGDSHVLDCISCIGAVMDDDQVGFSVGHRKHVDVCGQAAASGNPCRFPCTCVDTSSGEGIRACYSGLTFASQARWL